MSEWRRLAISPGAVAVLFVGAGGLHFARPDAYVRIVPPYLPRPRALVYASGIAEIAGGLGMLVPGLRRISGLWLVAVLVAAFPANVHMASSPEDIPGLRVPRTLLWARLPLQGLFIWWVLEASREATGPAPQGRQAWSSWARRLMRP
ncbi:MAG: DoxX family protein [Actinomycetota bacterium]|nr:DoxX family protein [Actinomycetota bacterium]